MSGFSAQQIAKLLDGLTICGRYDEELFRAGIDILGFFMFIGVFPCKNDDLEGLGMPQRGLRARSAAVCEVESIYPVEQYTIVVPL